MIGLLFHGPEVFDSGWAQKIINAFKSVDSIRCVLAGTMGRTAVFDSGLDAIDFWDKMPGACLNRMSYSFSISAKYCLQAQYLLSDLFIY